MSDKKTITPHPDDLRSIVDSAARNKRVQEYLKKLLDIYIALYKKDIPHGQSIPSIQIDYQCVHDHTHHQSFVSLPGGAFAARLEYFLTHYSEHVTSYFPALLDSFCHTSSALTALLWRCSYVLFVPRGIVVQEPIYPHLFFSDNACARGHVFIIVQESARVSVIEDETQKHAASCYTAYVGQNAQLIWFSDFSYIDKDINRAYCYVLQKNAQVEGNTCLTLDNNKATLSFAVTLAQPSGSMQWGGYYCLSGDAHASIISSQQHQAPDTKSSFILHGIVADKARSFYAGTININQNAVHSNAGQSNKNIIIGSDASAVSIPTLEVSTNAVQCRHGSATGILSDEALTYLATRGLTHAERKRILCEAFLKESLYGVDQFLAQTIIKKSLSRLKNL